MSEAKPFPSVLSYNRLVGQFNQFSNRPAITSMPKLPRGIKKQFEDAIESATGERSKIASISILNWDKFEKLIELQYVVDGKKKIGYALFYNGHWTIAPKKSAANS